MHIHEAIAKILEIENQSLSYAETLERKVQLGTLLQLLNTINTVVYQEVMDELAKENPNPNILKTINDAFTLDNK